MSKFPPSRHLLLRARSRLLGMALGVVVWAGLLSLPVAAQSSAEPAVVVGMTNTLKFTPDTVRVRVGESVQWKNDSVITHTVTADPAEATLDERVHLPDGATPFDSGTLEPEEVFTHTFEVPGRYRYFCIPHEATKMIGTVIVEPAEGD